MNTGIHQILQVAAKFRKSIDCFTTLGRFTLHTKWNLDRIDENISQEPGPVIAYLVASSHLLQIRQTGAALPAAEVNVFSNQTESAK